MNSIEQSENWVSEAFDVIGIEPWILLPVNFSVRFMMMLSNL
jgi:hypothetical protein